ncbi:unnamed protein product, partial [Nesidiocoris tenuis]
MRILNVSFSVRQPDGQMLPAQLLQERVHLNRNLLNKLSTLQVLQFDDNLCVREPCLNFEECVTVLKFGNASGFVASATMLFRPIYPVTTFACRCPKGFIGRTEHYLCDTEVNLCYSNPCMNGGDCKQAEGGFTCVCKPGFTDSAQLKTMVCSSTTAATISDTILSLWNSSTTATISVDECDTTVAVKFGDHINMTCASSRVQELESRCALVTESCHRFLDLTGPLQIGGLPPGMAHPHLTQTSFVGCIADVHVDHKLLDLN